MVFSHYNLFVWKIDYDLFVEKARCIMTYLLKKSDYDLFFQKQITHISIMTYLIKRSDYELFDKNRL